MVFRGESLLIPFVLVLIWEYVTKSTLILKSDLMVLHSMMVC